MVECGILSRSPMSTRNNLGPRHLPTWLGITLLSGLGIAASVIQEHFRLIGGWFAIAAYIVLLFATIIFSLRPEWGRRRFWLSVGILIGLHTLMGLLLILLFPTWLPTLRKFLSLIVVFDLLLSMSAVWRFTIAQKQKSASLT